MKPIRVAVTGVGGGVGQSILKALTLSTLALEVHAVDCHPLSAGLFFGTKRAVLPKPEIPGALADWEHWCKQNEIDVLIPGSDFDLVPFSNVREDWGKNGIAKVLVSSPEMVQMCRDKARLCEFLTQNELPSPKAIWDIPVDQAIAWAADMGYPVILKPRSGSGSRGFNIIHEEEELRFFWTRTTKPILQEYLDAENEEFTCAVFVNRDHKITGTFMAKRDLSAGSTYRAEVGSWPVIEELLCRLASLIRPVGPMNIQLRKVKGVPIPFEVNIRCSGTSAIRAHYGYNEPDMLIRNFLLGQDLPTPAKTKGYVLRYWNEVFLDGASARELSDCGAVHGGHAEWTFVRPGCRAGESQ